MVSVIRAVPHGDHSLCWPGELSPIFRLPLVDFCAIEDQIEALPTLYRIVWVDLTAASEKFRQSAMAQTELIHEA
jgi:hypothetical protein